jgi:hypothetical protein
MSVPSDPLALKRLLSPLLLGVDGVSGIGVPGGQLTIYLEADNADLRHRVEEIVAKATPTVTPRFEVTGRFRKQ